jgi:DNA gyrase subunit A
MVIAAGGTVRPVRIEDEMRSSYLDYAMSVIVARALPDVRDGLKPVQRRILYAMDELSLRSTNPYKKCARIVGEVLGKYHPHGDAPVYDALVRMAQDFSMRYTLVDGQGNFGSVDDDPPAAMRYTEARLSAIAEQMLVNIDQDTVNFAPNFDESLQEPMVLPARLPNLLVNGASGIAVGMATSIPPHNLTEVCEALVHLIDNPDANVDDLMAFVHGPDFPTSGIIHGLEGIREAYYNGHGRAVIRARTSVEESKTGRRQIIITELPYQLNKASLVEKIALLAKEKKIDGISDVRDESSREGTRVVVELGRTAQIDPVLNNLFKHTPMQSTFPINMLALVDGQPKVIGLKTALQEYILFRQIIITRRSEYELKKARARVHILEGLRTALDKLDAIIALIRSSHDVEAARAGLIEHFDLSQEQAQAILDMQLRRLAALEREKIEAEYTELTTKIAGLETLLSDPLKILGVMKEETEKLKKDFGSPRLTEIVAEEPSVKTLEELTPHQRMVITMSGRGYVKSIPFDTYRLQHRGGKGSRGQPTRDDDIIRHLLIADTHDVLLFFTTRGRVFSLRCFQIYADASKTARGTPVVNLVPLGEKESVSAILAAPSLHGEGYVVLATRQAKIKRMHLRALANIRSNGLMAMNLKPQDELISAHLAGNEDHVIMVTAKGQGIRFPSSSITIHSRQAGGMKGMAIGVGDHMINMEIAQLNDRLLTLSRRGYGKLTRIANYRVQGRGGSGVLAFKVVAKTGLVAVAKIIADCQELVIVSARGMIFRTPLSELPIHGRHTQGVMVMGKLRKDDEVVSVACLNEDNDSETSPATNTSPKKGI